MKNNNRGMIRVFDGYLMIHKGFIGCSMNEKSGGALFIQNSQL